MKSVLSEKKNRVGIDAAVGTRGNSENLTLQKAQEEIQHVFQDCISCMEEIAEEL